MFSCRLLLLALAVSGLTAVSNATNALTLNGWQYVFGFDDPSEPFGISGNLETNFHCDCKIVTPGVDFSALYPAYSGTRLLSVNSEFKIIVADPLNISWPAFGAFVTGAAPVVAKFYAYNYDSKTEVLLDTEQTSGANYLGSGGTPNTYLSFTHLADLTYADFSSTAPFTLDDVTIGLVDVSPGIPEPAAWALMLIGITSVGRAVRLRRRSNGQPVPFPITFITAKLIASAPARIVSSGAGA